MNGYFLWVPIDKQISFKCCIIVWPLVYQKIDCNHKGELLIEGKNIYKWYKD